MESERPYQCAAVAEGIDGIVYRIYGPGVETLGADFSQERGARIVAVVANSAYAEGRKSMEKELVELLEFVNRIMEFFKHYTYCPRCKSDIDHTDECELENAADSVLINFSRKCIDDFYVWKNARGIE